MGEIIVRKYSDWKRQQSKSFLRGKSTKSLKRHYDDYLAAKDKAIREKAAAEAQTYSIEEARAKADSTTGKIYIKEGSDNYITMTPEKYASIPKGELSSYKVRTKEVWERETGKQEENLAKARAEEKLIETKQELLAKSGMDSSVEAAKKAVLVEPGYQEKAIEKKQELLEKSGMEATREAAKAAVLVTPESYAEFTAFKPKEKENLKIAQEQIKADWAQKTGVNIVDSKTYAEVTAQAPVEKQLEQAQKQIKADWAQKTGVIIVTPETYAEVSKQQLEQAQEQIKADWAQKTGVAYDPQPIKEYPDWFIQDAAKTFALDKYVTKAETDGMTITREQFDKAELGKYSDALIKEQKTLTTGYGTGTISAREKARDFGELMIRKGQEWSQSDTNNLAEVAAIPVYTAGILASMGLHPIETAKGMVSPSAWIESAKTLNEKAKTGDVTLIGDLAAMYLVGKAGGAAAKKISPYLPKVKFEKFTIKTKPKVDLVKDVMVKTLSKDLAKDPVIKRIVTDAQKDPGLIKQLQKDKLLTKSEAVEIKNTIKQIEVAKKPYVYRALNLAYKDKVLAKIGTTKTIKQILTEPFKGKKTTPPKAVAELIKTEQLAGNIQPVTALEGQIAQQKISLTKAEQTRISSGLNVERVTEHARSQFYGWPEETATLNKAGVEVMKKFVESEPDAYVYGSFSAEAEMTGAKIPGDIDIHLRKVSGEVARAKAKAQVEKLRKVGNDVMIDPNEPTNIITRSGETAVDLKFDNMADAYKTGEGTYGFPFDQPLKKSGKTIKQMFVEPFKGKKTTTQKVPTEKIKYVPLSEQGLRKGASVLSISERGVMPKLHRMKDIGDFIRTQEVLIENIRNPLTKKYAKGNLEAFKQTYPKEFLKEIMAETEGKPVKMELFRNAGQKSPRTTIPIKPNVALVVSPAVSAGTDVKSYLNMNPATAISPSLSANISPGVPKSAFINILKSVYPETSPKTSPIPSAFKTSPKTSPVISEYIPSPKISPRPSPYTPSPYVPSPYPSPYSPSPYTSPYPSPYPSPSPTPSEVTNIVPPPYDMKTTEEKTLKKLKLKGFITENPIWMPGKKTSFDKLMKTISTKNKQTLNKQSFKSPVRKKVVRGGNIPKSYSFLPPRKNINQQYIPTSNNFPKQKVPKQENRMQMNVNNVIGKNYFSKSKKKQTIKNKIWG